MRASHKVLMEVDDYILLISGDPQGILDQQLRPQQVYELTYLFIISL
jgi:hypothetical protein